MSLIIAEFLPTILYLLSLLLKIKGHLSLLHFLVLKLNSVLKCRIFNILKFIAGYDKEKPCYFKITFILVQICA